VWGKDFPPLLTFGPTASVAIAVAAAHALGMSETWWAAISAFIVMQESFRASALRGLHRIVGSAAGAAFGYGLGSAIADQALIFVPAMGLLSWAGLYAALTSRYGYAWVLALVTFTMVMCQAVSPSPDLAAYATERMANVALGTGACVLVAGLFELGLRLTTDDRPQAASNTPEPAPGGPADRRQAILHALPGGISVTMLAAAVGAFDLGALTQGMVTTVMVMVVPLDRRSGEPTVLVTSRMLQRVVGCLLAGAVAFALLPLMQHQPGLCQFTLCAGVMAATIVELRYPRLRYGAIQFTIAFIMVFVQDQGWGVHDEAAFQRLSGILVGTLVLYAVFRLVHRIFRPS